MVCLVAAAEWLRWTQFSDKSLLGSGSYPALMLDITALEWGV